MREGGIELQAPSGAALVVRAASPVPMEQMLYLLVQNLTDHVDYKLHLFDTQEQTKALVRELDVALNGEANAAPQAALVDIVAQVKAEATKKGKPIFDPPAKPPTPTPKP